MSLILATISTNSWCFVPISTPQVSLTLKSLIMSPLIFGCCHSSLMLSLFLDAATPPRCCHSSSMLSFLLQCFHSSYYAGAISTILLILLQYCCSSFNVATPPSCCHSSLNIDTKSMLPLLWWIDVSANSQYYCSSIVVAAFPWMLPQPAIPQ